MSVAVAVGQGVSVAAPRVRWLPVLAVSTGGGLLLMGLADAASRAGNTPVALALFWLGMLGLFAPATWVLLGPTRWVPPAAEAGLGLEPGEGAAFRASGGRQPRRARASIHARAVRIGPSSAERLGIVVVLGLALYLVKVMLSPLALVGPDEFSHMRTLEDILRSTHLFGDNPLLAISSIYPGLEAAAATVTVTSGMDPYPLAIILIGVARLVTVLAIFLLALRVTGSGRVAGVASLVYMANPSFLLFDATFSYESFALPLAIVAIWATRRWSERGGRSAIDAVIALSATAATVVTHHLTSAALIAFLLAWALVALGRRRGSERIWPIAVTALWGMAAVGVWLGTAGTLAVTYLSTIVDRGVQELFRILAGTNEARRLFAAHTSFASPPPEIITAYLAVGLLLLSLPFMLVHAVRHRHASAILTTLALGALLYPASLALRITSSGAETSQRASAFVFLAIGIVGANWLVGRRPARFRPSRPVALIALLVVLAGGIITGNPPLGRLPGPYHVGAEQRSIEPQGRAAAAWALAELGPDNRIVTDRTNQKLMGSDGLQYPVTSANQHLGTAWAMYAVDLGQTQIDVLRRGGVRYLVVDLRLTRDVPEYPYIFEQSEPDSGNHISPMPEAAVEKWDGLPGVTRIYDSGDIIVYDIQDFLDGQP